jgi:hypothetical protein
MKKPANFRVSTRLLKAAKVIHHMGPKYLIIKKGEHGALLFHARSNVLTHLRFPWRK